MSPRKKANADSEPAKLTSVRLTPEDQDLVAQLAPLYYQDGHGLTGLLRALLREAGRRHHLLPAAATAVESDGGTP